METDDLAEIGETNTEENCENELSSPSTNSIQNDMDWSDWPSNLKQLIFFYSRLFNNIFSVFFFIVDNDGQIDEIGDDIENTQASVLDGEVDSLNRAIDDVENNVNLSNLPGKYLKVFNFFHINLF